MIGTAKGPLEFTNEVQHQLRVLPWGSTTANSAWKSAAGLPSFTKPAIRSAKLRQLWIAGSRADGLPFFFAGIRAGPRQRGVIAR